MKILTAEQMRQTDKACIEQGTQVSVLMENAGKRVAEEIQIYLKKLHGQHILCLAGAGNNGGDGLVAARYLKEWGAQVSVYLCSKRPLASGTKRPRSPQQLKRRSILQCNRNG